MQKLYSHLQQTLVFIFVLWCSTNASIAQTFSGGDGSKNDPFQIETAEQFSALSKTDDKDSFWKNKALSDNRWVTDVYNYTFL